MKWCFNNLLWRLLPGGVSALLIGLLLSLGSLQPLEQIAYRVLFQWRGETTWDDRVVVVKIDDKSLQEFGRFPLQRSRYTELLNVLTQSEASVVVFDMLWSEASSEDANLAQAMMQQGRVVLAHAWDNTGLPLQPTSQLENAAIATGHILKSEDSDGIVRKISPQIVEVPALGIAAVQAYSLVEKNVPLFDINHSLFVNWSRSTERVPSYSFSDVLRSKVSAHHFRNKIVIVGVTATGFDPLVTPFDHTPLTNGVYLQATLINNLLQQNFLHIPAPHWLYLILLLSSPGLSLLLYRYRTINQLVIGSSCLLSWSLLSLLFLNFNYWIPTAAPIVLFATTTGNVILSERLRINILLQKQVQQLWQAHYQDLVICKLDYTHSSLQSPLHQPISMQRVVQLATLAEQFARSQSAQATIARNLSLGLVAADLNGLVWFCNPIATKELQIKIGDNLQFNLVPNWLSQQNWHIALLTLQQNNQSYKQELQLNERWFEFKLEPLFYYQNFTPSTVHCKEPNGILFLLEETTKKKQDEIALTQLNQKLTEHTNQLELINKELETFSYAVSHDLRAPLRRIDGFSHLLLKQSSENLDALGKDYLNRIQESTRRMGELIEDLLNLSRITRFEMHQSEIDLSEMVTTIMQEKQQSQPDRQASFLVAPNLIVKADKHLLKVALENLLDNAWKYTSKLTQTQIEFGVLRFSKTHLNPEVKLPRFLTCIPSRVYFIKDNGAGFDMAYIDKLFSAFQRLHTTDEFPGTGVGLMTVQRIIHRHNGHIWAEGNVDRGATFYFTLSDTNSD
jgi:signal transduction histidine kinase/CHASE2 domain-containing sensor protein